jgi:hypothetical protein
MRMPTLIAAKSGLRAALDNWTVAVADLSDAADHVADALKAFLEANAADPNPVRVPANAIEFLADSLPRDLWERIGADPRRNRGLPAIDSPLGALTS